MKSEFKNGNLLKYRQTNDMQKTEFRKNVFVVNFDIIEALFRIIEIL